MGTISHPIAHAIIFTDEYSDDDCTKVITYNNQFDGALTYACVFRRENQNKYEESPACHNVQTVWTEQNGLTDHGKELFPTWEMYQESDGE